MAKFRVLRGIHSEGGKTYQAGDIVESASNLLKHNKPGSVKFGVSTEPTKEEANGDGLDTLTVAELRSWAETEEIDLGTATKKEDILKTIRLGVT